MSSCRFSRNYKISLKKKVPEMSSIEILCKLSPVSHKEANRLKMCLMFTYSICCSGLEFRNKFLYIRCVKNYFIYKSRFCTFFPFNKKDLYSNFTRLSENMTKYIESIVLKFKCNQYSKRCIFSKYFFFFCTCVNNRKEKKRKKEKNT